MSKQEQIDEVKGMLDALQVWFASRPYGWRERATAGQLRQWADREREEEYLIGRLETLEAK